MTKPILILLILLPSLYGGTAPLELQKNVIFVKASIGDSGPLDMALDSGTIRTTIDEAVARRLKLDLSLKARSSGQNGDQEISAIRDQTLRFAGAEVTESIMLAYPLDFVSKRVGRHIDGIIGVELLRKFVVTVDYAARRVEVVDPGTFVYSGAGESVPVTYAGRLPLVVASITPWGRAPIPVKLQVDSGGAAGSIVFWKEFVNRNDLLSGAHDVSDSEITGFTGTRAVKKGRLQALEIGGLKLAEPEVSFSDYQLSGGGGGGDGLGGNLGSGFLKQFKVIFDLPHDRVVFERP